jgi:hypothetical protein
LLLAFARGPAASFSLYIFGHVSKQEQDKPTRLLALLCFSAPPTHELADAIKACGKK